MCRSIKTLYNYEPKATSSDIDAASLQFVRKVSGYRKPSTVNQQAFDQAVAEISHVVEHLLEHLQTNASPKVR